MTDYRKPRGPKRLPESPAARRRRLAAIQRDLDDLDRRFPNNAALRHAVERATRSLRGRGGRP